MKSSKKIILFLVCFATVFSFMTVSASAEWNSTVGYYGSVTMEMLEEKLLFENNHNVAHKLQIKFDSDMGAYRLYYLDTGEWYKNTEGTFPYVLAGGDATETPPASTAAPPSISQNKFIEVKNLNLDGIQLVVLPEAGLAQSIQSINDDGFPCTMAKASINGTWYWVIMRSGGTSAAYYCNSAGQPYVALAEKSATDIEYNYTDNSNEIVVNGMQVADINNGVMNLLGEDGVVISLDIGSILYDTGDKSYTVNAYNTVYEGDTYYYTYYTYNITYNITNTYVTYIGSNDAYDKEEYEYYYQLPDGRSSADLTADEVAGMSFEFHDVVNYAKSATDVSVRALYHFDGDTEDSSYFSTQGAFEWIKGASITYMEAPEAFDGTLYLDNTAHSFDVKLPSSIGSTDFTLQFRYYQASEPDTVSNIDNSIQIGGTYVLFWDEKTASRDPNGQYATWALPVGTWNEIALVRNSGKLYVYLNGLCVSQESYSTVWNDTITFSFGSGSRAYSMIDELRVLNFALTEGGVSYTPTAVPFDSNLVLVLPDSARPIADEYWSWDTTIAPKSAFVFTDASYPCVQSTRVHWSEDASNRFLYSSGRSVSAVDGRYILSSTSSDGNPNVSLNADMLQFSDGSGIMFPLTYQELDYVPVYRGTFTITLVDSAGNIYFNTFDNNSLIYSQSGNPTSHSDWVSLGDVGRFSYYHFSNTGSDYTNRAFSAIVFDIYANKSFELVYMEIVPGSVGNTGHEKVTCIYPEMVMQPNTAAVQSTIPVNGYTVGGVRPTLPSKGDVWFPVSENRIQTCYIYTGSMWEEVGCRWYTGSRWIPIYAFDLTTLEDLFDIADASTAIPPIGSESAFWRWWQLQWLDFRKYLDSKFDELIAAIQGKPTGSGTDCKHQYSSEVTSKPGCIEPGYQTYTCSECGHQYTEIIDAHGHDWIVTGSVPDVLDEDGSVIEEGYDELTCSVCDIKAKDYGDGPEEQDLFDALGDFIADGITWLLDKLTELVDALKGITDTFSSFVEKIKVMAGDYPAFFGAFVALIPEELATLMWFALIAWVVVAVWKKWSK